MGSKHVCKSRICHSIPCHAMTLTLHSLTHTRSYPPTNSHKSKTYLPSTTRRTMSDKQSKAIIPFPINPNPKQTPTQALRQHDKEIKKGCECGRIETSQTGRKEDHPTRFAQTVGKSHRDTHSYTFIHTLPPQPLPPPQRQPPKIATLHCGRVGPYLHRITSQHSNSSSKGEKP